MHNIILSTTATVGTVSMLCSALFGALVSSCIVAYFFHKKSKQAPSIVTNNSNVESSPIAEQSNSEQTYNEQITSNKAKISELESKISELEDRLNRKIKECDCFVAERDKLAQRLSDTKDDKSKLLEGIQYAIHSLYTSKNKEDEDIMKNIEIVLKGIGVVVIHYTKDCAPFFKAYEGDSDMPVELLPALITQKEQEIVKKGIISVSKKL